MDRSSSYEMIRLYMHDMDRVVEKIRLEHEANCHRNESKAMLQLAEALIRLGLVIKRKFQPKESGCYIPHMIYRDK